MWQSLFTHWTIKEARLSLIAPLAILLAIVCGAHGSLCAVRNVHWVMFAKQRSDQISLELWWFSTKKERCKTPQSKEDVGLNK